MGVLSKTRKFLAKMIEYSYSAGQMVGEIKKDKDPRRIAKYSKIELSSAQKEAIDAVYSSSYGKAIRYDWHKYYQSFTGNFDSRYFAEYLLSTKLEPVMNPTDYRYVLGDKLLLHLFCNGIDNVRTPKTYCTKYKDLIISENKELISLEDLEDILSEQHYIIKPVQDTNSGFGIEKVDSGKAVKDILATSQEKALIVQECVGQHPKLKKLYPDGVNTFRVITYILDGHIYHVPVTLRIGRGGNFLDNCHAGGLFIGVDDTGKLNTYAFTEFGDEFGEKFTEHPDTGTRFENYILEFVPDMIQTAKKLHLNAPQLGMISWDLTVDENGCIVLIEANTRGQSIDMPQEANGKSAFGANTEKILGLIKK